MSSLVDIFNSVVQITTLLANVAVLVGIPLAIIQIKKSREANEASVRANELEQFEFVADSTRNRRQATLDFYCEINKETKPLIDRILIGTFNGSVDTILADNDLQIEIRRYLSLMERFSVGIQAYMFDVQLVDRIQGKSILLVHEKINPYVEYVSQTRGAFFYGDYLKLINLLKQIRTKREKDDYKGESEKFDKYYSYDDLI